MRATLLSHLILVWLAIDVEPYHAYNSSGFLSIKVPRIARGTYYTEWLGINESGMIFLPTSRILVKIL